MHQIPTASLKEASANFAPVKDGISPFILVPVILVNLPIEFENTALMLWRKQKIGAGTIHYLSDGLETLHYYARENSTIIVTPGSVPGNI